MGIHSGHRSNLDKLNEFSNDRSQVSAVDNFSPTLTGKCSMSMGLLLRG